MNDPILKSVKVQEVIDAIAVDGFDHLRGEWIAAYDGKITGGCVLSQGAFNLSVLPANDALPNEIDTGANDYTLINALDQFQNISEIWPTTDFGCGNAIVHWNDRYAPDDNRFFLETYEEVAQMVRDILAPYAEETITLQVIDYGNWLSPKVKV